MGSNQERTRKTDRPGFDPHPETPVGYSQMPDEVVIDEMIHPDGALPAYDPYGFRADQRAQDRKSADQEHRRCQESREFKITTDEVTGGGAPLFPDKE